MCKVTKFKIVIEMAEALQQVPTVIYAKCTYALDSMYYKPFLLSAHSLLSVFFFVHTYTKMYMCVYINRTYMSKSCPSRVE